MGDRELKSQLFDRLAQVGKALGNGKRLELLDLLAQGERSVEPLAAAAGLGLSTASAHLQLLRQAGLVTARRDGTRIHYALADLEVARLLSQLRTVAAAHSPEVREARSAYLGLGSRDEPAAPLPREALPRVADEVTLLDVRPHEEYQAGHLPGAVSIPIDELAERIRELPADREIIAYCRGADCVYAYEAVALLGARGLRARRLEEGLLEWRLEGRPVERAS